MRHQHCPAKSPTHLSMGRTLCRAVSRDRMLLERRRSGRVFQNDILDIVGRILRGERLADAMAKFSNTLDKRHSRRCVCLGLTSSRDTALHRVLPI